MKLSDKHFKVRQARESLEMTEPGTVLLPPNSYKENSPRQDNETVGLGSAELSIKHLVNSLHDTINR